MKGQIDQPQPFWKSREASYKRRGHNGINVFLPLSGQTVLAKTVSYKLQTATVRQQIHYLSAESRQMKPLLRTLRRCCSSHRSISFRESMPPPSNSAITDQSTGRSHWFLLPLELFFLAPFGRADNLWEQIASSPNRHLSHSRLLIPLGTPSLKNKLLLASHTLPTNSRTNILTGDTKRDTFSLLLLYTCFDNKPFFVVLFKRSFVIHLCCQIIYSVRETNHFPKH